MKSLIILLFLTTISSSYAGDRVGNGGGTHYCPISGTVEIYDLYEARTRYQMEPDEKLKALNSLSEIDAYLIRKLDHLNPYMAEKVWSVLQELDNRFIYLDNIDLRNIQDANFLMTNKNCKYAQLANWDETIGKIFVDAELFQKLSVIDIAGFRWHEAIYKFFRDVHRGENSDYTRKIVGTLFSNQTMIKAYDLDYERTGYPWFIVSGTSVYDLKLNIPYMTYKKKISVTIESFSEAEEKQLHKLRNDLLIITKFSEKKKIKKEIKILEAMKARNFCLTINSLQKINACTGKKMDIPVSNTLGFQIPEQGTGNYPLYFFFQDEFGDSIRIKLAPTMKVEEGYSEYVYVADVRFTFGGFHYEWE